MSTIKIIIKTTPGTSPDVKVTGQSIKSDEPKGNGSGLKEVADLTDKFCNEKRN